MLGILSLGIIQIDNHDTKIPLETFLDCLSITFIYERFLVEMRHDAFDSKSKQCMCLQETSDHHAWQTMRPESVFFNDICCAFGNCSYPFASRGGLDDLCLRACGGGRLVCSSTRSNAQDGS